MRKWKCAIVLAGLLVAGAAIGRFYLRAPDFGHRIYRIGWIVSPPFSVRDANGDPTGIAIDLVNQSARRRGIFFLPALIPCLLQHLFGFLGAGRTQLLAQRRQGRFFLLQQFGHITGHRLCGCSYSALAAFAPCPVSMRGKAILDGAHKLVHGKWLRVSRS